MSQVELIWGAFSLMLLGALVTMCLKCQQSGSQQKTGTSDWRRRREHEQRFQDPELSSSASREDRARIPRSHRKASKGRRHRSIPKHDGAEPRYQNLGKGTQMEQEYIEPLHVDYYNCGNFLRPPRDEDSHSYQNVTVPFQSIGCAEVGIYQNSVAIQLPENPQISGSSEDDEPDYINVDAECPPNRDGDGLCDFCSSTLAFLPKRCPPFIPRREAAYTMLRNQISCQRIPAEVTLHASSTAATPQEVGHAPKRLRERGKVTLQKKRAPPQASKNGTLGSLSF